MNNNIDYLEDFSCLENISNNLYINKKKKVIKKKPKNSKKKDLSINISKKEDLVYLDLNFLLNKKNINLSININEELYFLIGKHLF